VPILDFYAAFDDGESRRLMVDSCHFGAEGARRAARLVADEVVAREAERSSRTVAAGSAAAH
jgi:hypothetical protein